MLLVVFGDFFVEVLWGVGDEAVFWQISSCMLWFTVVPQLSYTHTGRERKTHLSKHRHSSHPSSQKEKNEIKTSSKNWVITFFLYYITLITNCTKNGRQLKILFLGDYFNTVFIFHFFCLLFVVEDKRFVYINTEAVWKNCFQKVKNRKKN